MNNKKADTLLKANGWGRTTPWVHYTVEGGYPLLALPGSLLWVGLMVF